MKLSEFLVELRKAVNEASSALSKNNVELLKEYFDEKSEEGAGNVLSPKTVCLNYPVATEQGAVEMRQVDVPLIALVPMNASKVGKATFSVDFQLDDDDGEVVVSFPKKHSEEEQNLSHLEISIVPDELPEGISSIARSYSDVIERQIEG